MKNPTIALNALLFAGLVLPGLAVAQDEVSSSRDSQAAQLKITAQDERDTRTDLSDYFTGSALVNPLFSAEGDSHATSAKVTFEPGARTNWHTHPVGQQLVVTDGIGWVQIEGQPNRTIRAGDVVWIPADTNHWHGATPNHSMTHIAVQERRDGKNVVWGDAVGDQAYHGE